MLFDILLRYCTVKPESKGTLRSHLKEMALAQTGDEAIRRAYLTREPENCGIRPKEVFAKPASEAAELLWARLQRTQESLAALERDSWVASFVQECDRTAATLRADWDDSWRKECDAKRLFKDIQARYQAKISIGFLKAEVMKEMRVRQTDDWKVLQTLLRDALSQSVPNAV